MQLCPLSASVDGQERRSHLKRLQSSWSLFDQRAQMDERLWVEQLAEYLQSLVESRLVHVQRWIEVNTSRFKSDSAGFQGLIREFESLSVALKASIQLCALQCNECQLLCLESRYHDGMHSCQTSHSCPHTCSFKDDHSAELFCGLP